MLIVISNLKITANKTQYTLGEDVPVRITADLLVRKESISEAWRQLYWVGWSLWAGPSLIATGEALKKSDPKYNEQLHSRHLVLAVGDTATDKEDLTFNIPKSIFRIDGNYQIAVTGMLNEA